MSFFRIRLNDLQSIVLGATKWDICFVCLWFTGPFLYIIERTPADIWLSVIGIAFIFRSANTSQWKWLATPWVQFVGLFWFVALLASAISDNPLYSLGEAIIWIRFPLYAAACMFWLGTDRVRLNLMFVTMGLATAIMTMFLAIEFGNAITVSTSISDRLRLSGPYGDLVPGNFLGKAMMPLAVVLAAVAMDKSLKRGLLLAMASGSIVVFTMITGERVNSALAGLAVFLAAFAWVWRPKRIVLFGTIATASFLLLFSAFPGVGGHFLPGNKAEITDYFNSPYWFSVRPGIVAAIDSPMTGIGVGMHRLNCPAIPQGPKWLVGHNDCHPHPHQFYVQLAEETGLFGLLTGVIMIVSIILTAAAGRKHRSLYSSIAWIPPALLFFPQPSADFFGQWNNLFLWFAIGLALAMAQDRDTLST